MIESLPTRLLNECNVVVVIGPPRSGKTTLIRECASQQNHDVGLLFTTFAKNGWEGFVPQGSIFKKMMRSSDVDNLTREHRKCFILDTDVITSGVMKEDMQIFNARYFNRFYWLECQSQSRLPLMIFLETDMIFVRQANEKQLKWLYDNHARSLPFSLTTFKDEVAKIDAIPYAYTVLVHKGSMTNMYYYVAGKVMTSGNRLGSDLFWNEMKALESNEYVQYSNVGHNV